jgi:hypothetical protein
VSPEKAAVAVVWKNKGFALIQIFAWAVWTALALSWFWLPDSKVWGVALSFAQGLAVILGGFWLMKTPFVFYRREHACSDGKPGLPRLLLGAVLLVAIGVCAPYKLIGWRPVFSSFAAQTVSLVIRFGAGLLIAVSAWLMLASLLGTGSAGSPAQPSSAPLAPQSAQPD